ncbi:hypothetical protein DFH08DRAFT_897062 [Mycena albidolilacea]|uniref:Uncharacterized protein n=1 Tax=Mycena albidolilacea TaxID=1033008 RepID=A0AAD6Z8Y9_9AGAR|nr:hypothetical protein DFH08DRAFT_897062 [Mycena albidolilacea]
MYQHLSRSASHRELLHNADGNTRTPSATEDCKAPVESATLHRSRKGRKIFRMKSAESLRLLSLCFHSTLVVIHLALIPVWFKKLENRVVFALQYQSIVSFFITAVTQTFGTIYLAVLVLVTQKLSMRRNLVTAQPLTATHDNTAAWAGIGSAFLHIWHQKAVRASITGILSVFLYLATVLVLHITTPGLFSLETFNSTTISVVHTEGLPAMNMSGYTGTTSDNLSDYIYAAVSYIPASLYYLPYVDGSTNIGLTGGSLYDVPKTNAAIGTIAVHATAFNITCDFLEDLTADFSKEHSLWSVSSGGSFLGWLESTQPRVISTGAPDQNGVFYSTIPIIDSNNNTGGVVRLTHPMNSMATVSSIQIFQCFLSVMEQTAVLDAESKKMVALHPELIKRSSAWHPENPYQTFPTTGNPLLDEWALWYSIMPMSNVPRGPAGSDGYLSLADLYLIRKFNLHSANQTSIPSAVTLHDLENALSELVATMFWTIGHIVPTYQVQVSDLLQPNNTAVLDYRLSEVENPILLLSGGDATATERSIKVRLDLNIIAVSIGLAGSIVLMLLSLQYSLLRIHHENEQDLPIDGTGLLHAIWMYRNHPELELFLEQVDHPTDDNLRHAGMVRTRLVGRRSRETESMDSAQLHPQAEKSPGMREVVLASLDGL